MGQGKRLRRDSTQGCRDCNSSYNKTANAKTKTNTEEALQKNSAANNGNKTPNRQTAKPLMPSIPAPIYSVPGANTGSPSFDSKNYSEGLSVGAIIHQREKSFFNDVSSAHLQKGHPLAHLATSFRSIQQHPPGGFDKSSNAHTLNPYSNQPNLNKVFATKSVRDEKGNQRMQRDFLLNSSSKHHREFLLSTLREVETHANTPNVLRTWAHQAAGGNGNNTAQAAPLDP